MDSLIPLKEEHQYLESIIERGRHTFIEVGTALMTIREKKSYRTDGYDTFEEYCQERWGWTHQRAYQLMQAAEVIQELKSATIVAPLPANEGQARELTRIPDPETRREVWQELHQEHGGNVTAANVREAVRLRLSIPPRQPVAKNDSIHLALKHLSLATMIDPIDFIESAGGIEDIFMNNVQMLEQIERAQEWLRRYADALRQRLGVEPQQIRRVQ